MAMVSTPQALSQSAMALRSTVKLENPRTGSSSRSGGTAYVVNTISQTITPIRTRTRRAAAPIHLGGFSYPTVLVLAPIGHLAIALGTYSGRVTLVDTVHPRSVTKLVVGRSPVGIAFGR